MNARSLGTALALSALAYAPLASAQAPAAPKPAPEMAQLKTFEGSWTCTGDVPAGPMGPAQKTKTTVKAHIDPSGFWQVGTVSVTSPAMSFHGTFQNTYDPGQKRIVELWSDSMGGYAIQTSAGWEGDKMIFLGEGSMGGQKMQTRETFVRSADGASLVRSEEMQVGGQWVPAGTDNCHRPVAAAAPKK